TRRTPRDAVELLLGGARHLSRGLRRALGNQHVHRRPPRAGDGRYPARDGPAVMPPHALAAVATLLAVLPHGNRIELQLDRGSAELIWITPGTFHFRRVLNGPLHPCEETAHEPVTITTAGTTGDTGGQVRLRSRLIEVTIEKHGLMVGVRLLDGTPLMLDLTEARSEAGGVVWERQSLPGAAFYGLGPRSDPGLDRRLRRVSPRRGHIPFRLHGPETLSHTGSGDRLLLLLRPDAQGNIRRAQPARQSPRTVERGKRALRQLGHPEGVARAHS